MKIFLKIHRADVMEFIQKNIHDIYLNINGNKVYINPDHFDLGGFVIESAVYGTLLFSLNFQTPYYYIDDSGKLEIMFMRDQVATSMLASVRVEHITTKKECLYQHFLRREQHRESFGM